MASMDSDVDGIHGCHQWMASIDGDVWHPWMTSMNGIHGWRWMAAMDDINGGNPWMAMDSTHGQHQWMPSRATSMDAIHGRHQWMASMDDDGWHPWTASMDGILIFIFVGFVPFRCQVHAVWLSSPFRSIAGRAPADRRNNVPKSAT